VSSLANGIDQASCERRRMGERLLAPAPESFTDAVNTIAARHLARAWSIEVGA
jgi:hypothetical protein